LACATLRVFALLNIPEVPRPPKPSAPWWREVAVPLTDARFRGFLMFTATYYVALGMVETFTLVYLAELGFSPRTLNLCIAAGSLGAVLSLFGWGRLADLVGGRPVFGMCSLTVAGLMVAWQFVRPFSPAAVGTETASAVGVALLLFTLMGIFDGGFGLSQTRQAMGLVPRTHQAIYFSLHTVAIQGTMGVGAFIAGHFTALAATAAPGWFGLGWDAYRWLFLGSVPVFLLAAWLNGLVAPETDRSTREVVGKAVAYPTAALWGIVRRR
jgi:MFS family permease